MTGCSRSSASTTSGGAAGGIYIHVPFCLQKCAYCDFYSTTDPALIPLFVAAAVQEIGQAAPVSPSVDTVYIGGGTPSLLAPDQVGALLSAVHASVTVLPGAEITLEVNPGTIDSLKLTAFKSAGINRISIGVQSFVDANLATLGRIHTAREAVACVRTVRAAGFDNVSLDLIYGLPGQSRSSLEFDLAQAIALTPEHLSCYLLSYEPGTPLDEAAQNGRVAPLSDTETGDFFTVAAGYLARHGYDQYEVSNFARHPSLQSRHNLKYWNGAPYLGFGPSAHTFTGTGRRWNHRSLDDYLADLAAGKLPVAGQETLTADQQMIEALYLGLRQAAGIPIARFEARFGVCFQERYADLLADLRRGGHLRLSSDRCRLTTRGMRFLDSIVDRFVGVDSID